MTQPPQIKRIAVMTSGGDAPGMNAGIRAVVRWALAHQVEVLGIQRGYYGLVGGELAPLGARDVGGRIQEGGTFLRTARLPEFKQQDVQQQAVDVLASHEVGGLVVIGGDGSLSGALALHSLGVRVAGVPATIDNDMCGTDLAIGVDTALNTILEAIDRLRDTASSHGRIHVIETMGRHCGYLAMMAGVTGGAEIMHIPEVPLSLAEMLATVEQAWARGKAHVIITVAEGAEHDVQTIASYMEREHRGYECRVSILGHIQRGGRPTHFDRLLATRLGVHAVQCLLDGQSGQMAALQGAKITAVPLPDVIGCTRAAPVDEHALLRTLAQ